MSAIILFGHTNISNHSREVSYMGKRERNRGKSASGVNPQGYGQDTTEDPKSKLENAAKKKNTK